MIRAFFNIRLDDAYLPERSGQWVRDAGEARTVARTIVRRLVVQHGGEPRLLNAVMAVTDADGAPILDLSFFEALYVPVAAPERDGTEPPRAESRTPHGTAGPRTIAVAAQLRRLATSASLRRDAALAWIRTRRATPPGAADLSSVRPAARRTYGFALEPGR